MAAGSKGQPSNPEATSGNLGEVDLTHLDSAGRARMVDVGEKAETRRRARASGRISMKSDVLQAIHAGRIQKGEVLAVARVAGIQAAKETARWIPLCHPLGLDSVEIVFSSPDSDRDGIGVLRCEAVARTSGKTGVEMEALTAVSAALLTVYDMCKAADRAMTISTIQLEEKEGGRSGHYVRAQPQPDQD